MGGSEVDAKFRILDTRHKAWVFTGVELELDLIEATERLATTQPDDTEDKAYYRRQRIVLEKKLALVNERVAMLEAQMESYKPKATRTTRSGQR